MSKDFKSSSFHIAPKVVIHVNACNLHEYCLYEQPSFFQERKFLVNRLHWKNHSGKYLLLKIALKVFKFNPEYVYIRNMSSPEYFYLLAGKTCFKIKKATLHFFNLGAAKGTTWKGS